MLSVNKKNVDKKGNIEVDETLFEPDNQTVRNVNFNEMLSEGA